MNPQPFRTSADQFIEIPVTAQGGEEKAPDIKDGASAAVETKTAAGKAGWFSKVFGRRKKDLLLAELTELKSNYSDLLAETKEIRERLEVDGEERHAAMAEAVAPFPDAIKDIKAVRASQKEAADILLKIRDQVQSTAERDGKVLDAMETLNGGLGRVDSSVATVNESVGSLSLQVGQAKESTLEGVERIDKRVKNLSEDSRERSERIVQGSNEMKSTLNRMERNGQRALWVCAILLAAVLVMLMVLAVQAGKTAAESTALPEQSSPNLVVADDQARVLTD
ncbi:MAG: hypothetical protein Q7Q71_06495 [Verrucomicrobiota bacterium JB023]|nr:hypothetical protein [Verrucomicrobiota bacterium JB023]